MSKSVSWTLQDALQSAIATNVSRRALDGPGPQRPEDVFFRSHLLDLRDPHVDPGVQGLPSSGVFHPGEVITLGGFFLDNSALGVVARLTSLQDPAQVVRGGEACQAKDQYETSCPLPSYSNFGAFGEFVVSLEEKGTGMLLSDDHSMVVLLVLPVPVILAVTQAEVVASSQTAVADEGALRLQ